MSFRNILPYLAGVDAAHERMIETVVQWASVNSGTGNLAGLDRMAALAAAAFAEVGLTLRCIETEPVLRIDDRGQPAEVRRGPVLFGRLRPGAPRRVALAGHMDTVFPADSPFQTVTRLPDGRLNGPGVADMKGGILVMLEALRAFEASPFAASVGIDVMLNADEETGTHASDAFFRARAREADAGLIYEPAMEDGSLASSRAGSANYDVVVRGLAAHAGREFAKGRNAIVAAAELVRAVAGLNGKRENVTLNIGLMTGGSALNVVPDTAVFRLNVRARRAEDLAWAHEAVRDAVASTPLQDGVTAEVHGAPHRPVKEDSEGLRALLGAVKEAGAALGQEIRWAPTGGCCDGNQFADEGLAVVDTLGVRGGKIHSPDEFAIPESFTERAKLSALTLMLLATGEAPWPARSKPKEPLEEEALS